MAIASRLQILGVPVDALTRSEALERCTLFLTDHLQHHIVTVNPEFVVEARHTFGFLAVLQKSDLALADGIGVVLAARLLHGAKLERISGIEYLVDLCALAEQESASVFFLGGKGGVARKTAAVLQGQFPRLQIAGWGEHPLDMSAGQQVDIVFVAFGAPKQELWIAENLPKLPHIKIAMGVGGAFDMISGKIKRAPQFLRKLGLEWLWRFAQEPQRFRRIFKATVVFPWAALRSAFGETSHRA